MADKCVEYVEEMTKDSEMWHRDQNITTKGLVRSYIQYKGFQEL